MFNKGEKFFFWTDERSFEGTIDEVDLSNGLLAVRSAKDDDTVYIISLRSGFKMALVK